MNMETIITRLRQQAQTVQQLATNVPDQQAGWKPDADSWSILEVVNHLYDEEREDFRARVDHVLHPTNQQWSAINPQGWVTMRAYEQRDLGESLHNFLHEREQSLTWLQGLVNPDWQRAYEAPWGPITAGDLLASWLAHDLLHIRQLSELHYQYNVQMMQPYKVDYAGGW